MQLRAKPSPLSLAVCSPQKCSQWDDKGGTGLESGAPAELVATPPHGSGRDTPVTPLLAPSLSQIPGETFRQIFPRVYRLHLYSALAD